jgi:hypothetical protein
MIAEMRPGKKLLDAPSVDLRIASCPATMARSVRARNGPDICQDAGPGCIDGRRRDALARHLTSRRRASVFNSSVRSDTCLGVYDHRPQGGAL